MNARTLLVGLVAGLVLGAGAASLVWALTSGGDNDDVAAVCGIVERTPLPDEDTPIEELRRWGVAEVLPSVAKENPEYQPLADAMTEAMQAVQRFDTEKLRAAVERVKQLCD